MINSLLKLFGIIIINYIIYVYLILTRIPRTLYIFYNEGHLNIKLFLIIMTGLFLSLFIIIKNMRILYFHNKKDSESKIQKMMITFQNIMDNSLKEVYQLIINNVRNNYNVILSLSNSFYMPLLAIVLCSAEFPCLLLSAFLFLKTFWCYYNSFRFIIIIKLKILVKFAHLFKDHQQ